MSEPGDYAYYRRAVSRTLDLYLVVTILMLIGIAVLVAYAIRLGPLTSPGAEESFGLALALLFLMASVIAHVVDRAYRTWPLGRRVRVAPPEPITERGTVAFLRILVFVIAALAIAYFLGGLIA